MRLLLASLVVSALAACSLVPPRHENPTAHYDLGPPPATAAQAPALSVRAVEVESPTWLDGTAMHYRLAYADATRRESYGDSRWVAAPGELMQRALRRAVFSGADSVRGGCTLRVDLDEFLHVFDQSSVSFGLVEARAALFAPRTDTPVALRSFSLRQPAPSPDAPGGVAALSGAVEQLAQGIREWLAALERDAAAGMNVAQACRGS